MNKKFGVLFVCFGMMLVNFFSQNSASYAAEILYQRENTTFTQEDADDLLEFAEYLARSKFSDADRVALKIWSINDFKAAPLIGQRFYRTLRNTILPKTRLPEVGGYYRAELYLDQIKIFAANPHYAASPNNFLALVDRYNPPKREALQLQQIQINMVMQSLQQNQVIFNQTMQQQKRVHDMLSDSFQETTLRQSITLSGGIITQDLTDRYVVKYLDGSEREVMKHN